MPASVQECFCSDIFDYLFANDILLLFSYCFCYVNGITYRRLVIEKQICTSPFVAWNIFLVILFPPCSFIHSLLLVLWIFFLTLAPCFPHYFYCTKAPSQSRKIFMSMIYYSWSTIVDIILVMNLCTINLNQIYYESQTVNVLDACRLHEVFLFFLASSNGCCHLFFARHGMRNLIRPWLAIFSSSFIWY